MIYQDISSLLQTGGIGTLGTNLFWGFMPNTPSSCTSVYEYMGEPPVYSKNAMHWERPRLQVVTRAEKYVDAMSKAEAVYAILGNAHRLTLNGVLYDSIRARQRPFADPKGRDDDGRFRVYCNYALKKAP